MYTAVVDQSLDILVGTETRFERTGTTYGGAPIQIVYKTHISQGNTIHLPLTMPKDMLSFSTPVKYLPTSDLSVST